jgi:hypothetical protein
MDNEKVKDEYLKALDKVPEQAARIEALGQEMIEAARFSRDIASATKSLLAQPSGNFGSGVLQSGLASWQSWFSTAQQVEASRTMVNSFGAVASGAANTSISLTTCLALGPGTSPLPAPVKAASGRLVEIVSGSGQVNQARASLVRLGLDTRSGTSLPSLDLLSVAEASLSRPPVGEGSPTAILVTLRESIDAAITELGRRKPLQEKTPNWCAKVQSLGRHCGYSLLSANHFDLLGTQADIWMNRLSGYKQASAPREEIQEVFYGGVTFLNSLLSSIDESKLRK